MADFTQGQNIGTAQASGISAPSGSGDGAGTGVAIALDTAADMVSIFGQRGRSSSGASYAQVKSEQANTLSGSYVAELATIADAVQSGDISSSEGQSRSRAKFQSYVAANPAYTKELISAHTSFVGGKGLGNVIATGSEEEQRARAVQGEADKLGISADTYVELQRSLAEMEYVTKQNGLLKAKADSVVAADNAEIQLMRNQDARLQIEADRAMRKVSASGHQVVKDRATAIINGDMDQKSKILALEELRVDSSQLLGTEGAWASKELRDTTMAFITQSIDLAMKQVDDRLDQELLSRERAMIEDRFTLSLAYDHPQVFATAAMGKFIGQEVFSLLDNTELTTQLAKSIAEFSAETRNPAPGSLLLDPPGSEGPDSVEHNKTVTTYHKMLDGNIQNWSKKDEEGKQVTVDTFSRVLENYTAVPMKPDQVNRYENLIKTISDPKSAEFFIQNHEALGAAAPDAQEFLNSYGRTIEHVLETEFAEMGGVSMTYSPGAGVVFTGRPEDRQISFAQQTTPGAISFEDRRAEYERRFPDRVPGSSGAGVRNVSRMNSMGAPLLNRYIRMVAHLSGHKDYMKVWEEIVKPVLTPSAAVVEEVDVSEFTEQF